MSQERLKQVMVFLSSTIIHAVFLLFSCCSVVQLLHVQMCFFFLLIIFQEIFRDVLKCVKSLFDLSR